MRRATLLVPLLLTTCSGQDEPQALPNPLIAAAALIDEPAATLVPRNSVSPRQVRRFKPLREGPILSGAAPSEAMVALGRMLYFDRRLSKTGEVSCNSCHPLDAYGVTHERVSRGIGNQKGSRNAPTTYLAAGQFAQFWDGRAADVEQQAKGPILDPLEMGMESGAQVESRLKNIPGYVDAFARAFPADKSPISLDHVGFALGAFERGLVTPSRWDKYLRGDPAALSETETDGLRLFTSLGCAVCHSGELVGGSRFETIGAAVAWPNQHDRGRFEATHAEADKMVFKVPSLRNVAKTAPYFHDGSARSLDEAVTMMARYQLGQELEDDEVQSLVAWLSSLTGDLPVAYISPPALPPDPKGAKP